MEIRNSKIMVMIAIALMAANCGLVGILWFNHFSKKPRPVAFVPPVQGQAFEYLTSALKLTPSQVKKYDTLRLQHVSFTRQTSADQRAARDSFFELVKQPAASKAVVSILGKRIAADQQKLDSATFYHFRSFRAILHTDQQAKFDTIFRDVLHMMAGPHRGGAPGAGPQGPPMNGPMQGPPPNGRPGMRGGNPDGHFPPPGPNAPERFKPNQPAPPEELKNGQPPKGWLPIVGPRGRQVMGPDGKPLYAPPGSHTTPNGGPPPDGPPPGEGPPPNGGPPPADK